MAALLKCINIAGGLTLVEADPPILSLSDVIYVPFNDPHSPAGLFDHGQKLIFQSWYFRGINPLGGAAHGLGTPYEIDTLPSAPDNLYIYGGWLHYHFGHFLLSTLSRYWSRLWEQYPDAKILVHTHEGLDHWFSRSWFSKLVSAMGLSRDRFVSFDRAMVVRRMLVTAPAFEEEHFAHRAYARFCNMLGLRLAGDRIGQPNNRPVFLSKERMTSGVQRLENEAEITAVLERNGVEIVFPELLSLEEQAALWHNRPFISSFANSALHASAFAPGRNIIGIGYSGAIMSNYMLVDRANNTNALYLRPGDGVLTHTGEKDGFNSNHLVNDPVGVAEDLLRALDFQQRTQASRNGISIVHRSPYWSFADAGPLPADPNVGIVNLALGRPVRQSSAAPFEPFRSPNANSGLITGYYQFHTDQEQDPWWEIDLQTVAAIHQVRLFNRLDNSGERCSLFAFSSKHTEDAPLETVFEQREPLLFGGLDGKPFSWMPEKPVTARFFRVTLRGHAYFHLDQVEILGATLTPGCATPIVADGHVISRPRVPRFELRVARKQSV